jgi:hypothetical protein
MKAIARRCGLAQRLSRSKVVSVLTCLAAVSGWAGAVTVIDGTSG